MFDTIMGFGDQAFTVIVLVVAAGVSSHIMYGFGTKRGKDVFILSVLILTVAVQVL